MTQIIFVSGREPSYVRNAVILRGLRINGANVVECTNASKSYLVRYPKVVGKFLLKNKKDCDAVFIGYFGQPLAGIIRKLTPRAKPIIFDAFLSAYDTMCFDRKKFRPESLMGKYFYRLDKHSCEIADKVLLDTNAHIDYFVNTFGLERERFQRVFVGADDSMFYPRDVARDNKKFTIFYYTTFHPVHGVEYMVEAAKRVEKHEDIEFKLVGTGMEYKKILKLADTLKVRNVKFMGWTDFREFPMEMAKADVCLGGHFSDIDKGKRAISEKAFEAIAMKRAVIVGDNPANRELFTNKENALLVEMANADALADAILELRDEEKLREKIAEGGYRIYRDKCSPEVIGREVKEIIEKTVDSAT
ncbi:MAG: glycosyltransferase [Methanocellales archaeon]|nr:glycosyltransferase [Methanocellales archaeon]MDD3420919.1 glycosyltransferase [Methanocellales archaeon]MDD4897785.1 glycosyltransferase [Methanocellales archaeon]MDD5446579.1 glycosyltransferase [Methanocellales archaeon]